VAGPGVFEGYWRRPQETGTAFVIDDGVRWFRTGDTVRRDPDGSVRVLGRTSVDILKSAGYKLSAPEIEEAIRRHPAVRDAAVVGLPDETYGQRVAAAVMLGGDGIITPDELIDFLRDELAGYQLPRLVRIVDDLPRNALGKVVKPELMRLLAG
jgi:malonyl-CoA/methylmalonyl-CoA synthetase